MTTTPTKTIENVQWGVILAILGYGIFSGQDAAVKWLVEDYTIWQILFVRSLTVTIISLVIGRRKGIIGVARSRNKGGLLLRAALLLGAWLCYYNAARELSLPDLVTLYYAAPVFVTVMSIFLLRETVTRARWAAVIVGFIGVAIAANPTGRPEIWPALLVLVAASFWAFATILVRKIMDVEPTINQMLFTNGLFVVVCAVTLPWMWQQPDLFDLLLMVGLGCASGAGQYLL